MVEEPAPQPSGNAGALVALCGLGALVGYRLGRQHTAFGVVGKDKYEFIFGPNNNLARYNFGPNKKFTGTREEWKCLKNTKILINPSKEKTCVKISENSYSVTVKCPHCGSKNYHSLHRTTQGHRECDAGMGERPSKIYHCPGYVIELLTEAQL